MSTTDKPISPAGDWAGDKPAIFGSKPGEGVTLVLTVHVPKGHGPDYSARFWGRNDVEARAKLDAYTARLPKGHTPDAAIERRIGH